MKARLLSAEIVVMLLALIMTCRFLPVEATGPAEVTPADSDRYPLNHDFQNHIRPPPLI